ncbi:zinc-binding alcohol dehydrogenase [Leifsonia sp. NPDC058230]|uniref:zinc-dependent alcohol dehydrogenase n=1 Tax=Leifsonia sp. NPDC058230 TaxID=3346391 RepID=UPI0036D8AC49
MTSTTTRTARTATLVAPRSLEVFDEELPAIGATDVLLQTLYSGISAGTEMNVYRGSAALWRTRRDPDNGLFEPTDEPEWTYPMAYGYAAVSRIVEAGAEVIEVSVGDLVYTYTSHSSAAVVPAASVIVLPPLDDPRIGVLNANLNTAYNGVLDAHPNLGDVVVVSGLGVIGLIQVQLLRRLGVRVIGVDGVAERRALAERFGAEVTLEPGDHVAREVRALTNNRGADIVIEVSGASAALNEAIRIAGYNGTVIAMSWYGGSFENLSLVGEFHHNRPRIISSQVGGLSPDLGPLWSLKRRQEVVSSLMGELDLEPLITHERPIEEAAEAYRIVDSRPNDLVQFVLTYTD